MGTYTSGEDPSDLKLLACHFDLVDQRAQQSLPTFLIQVS